MYYWDIKSFYDLSSSAPQAPSPKEKGKGKEWLIWTGVMNQKTLLKLLPLIAAKPPTRAPIKAVIKINRNEESPNENN